MIFVREVLNFFTVLRFFLSILSIYNNPISPFLIFSDPPEYLAMRLDCTHSQSGSPSFDDSHASDVIIIFVRQSLFVSELLTSSLSFLDSYSDYEPVNISLKNSPFPFLNMHPISSADIGRPFSPFILPSSKNFLIPGDFNCHHPPWYSSNTRTFEWKEH